MEKTLIYLILLLFIACNRPLGNNDSKGLFPIKEFGKWGYIDTFGKTVITCQFDDAKPFSEGFAAVLIDSLWGFIDKTGEVVIEPQFKKVHWQGFSDELCEVTFQSDTGMADAFVKKNGSIAFISQFDKVSTFAFGRATTLINEEVCVIDKSGNILFNTHYPYGGDTPLQDGIVHVWSSDSTKYYDRDGNLLIQIKGMGHENFSEGFAQIRTKYRDYYIDKKGEIVITPENPHFNCSNFSEGLARVYISGANKEFGFIDKAGKMVISITCTEINDFKDGLAAFKNNNLWGFIDKIGKTVIEPQFEDVDYDGFSNGLCAVKQNHKWGYVNYNGEFVWQEQIGLEYTKLDLSKWKLDTLEIDKPLYANKYAGIDNFPRKQTFASLYQLTLKVDTADVTVFLDKYFANKLYLINASKDTVRIPAQDGHIKIIQQAKNKKGKWQDIENFINSWCGNSYHFVTLIPNEYQIFATPIFKGEFKTQLRFKLELEKQTIYSNIYWGNINYEQLLNPKDKDKIRIAVWTY